MNDLVQGKNKYILPHCSFIILSRHAMQFQQTSPPYCQTQRRYVFLINDDHDFLPLCGDSRFQTVNMVTLNHYSDITII